MDRRNNFSRWLRCLIFILFVPAFLSYSQSAEDLRWCQWNEGVNAVQASGKFMLVDIYTGWCTWCKRMDRKVFGHTRVQQMLAENFVLVKLNAESPNMVTNGSNQYTEQDLAKMLGAEAYPTVLVYNSQFQLVSRFTGYKEPEEFIRYLKYISGKHYLEYSFKEYLKRVRE